MKRKTFMIPLSVEVDLPKEYELSMSRPKYRVDIFYSDEWDDCEKRPVICHFAGAGLTEPYNLNSDLPKHYVKQGWVWIVTYYYHHSFKDDGEGMITSLPAWNEDWNDSNNYFQHLTQRSYMVQSILEAISNELLDGFKCMLNKDKITLIGKSRGGATLLCWSYLSRAYKKKYPILGIINSQGYIGSTTTGRWIDYNKTIQTLSQLMTFQEHKVFCVYNDKDLGGYDLPRRLAHAVPFNHLNTTYFINFPDEGHTINPSFTVNISRSLINGEPPMHNGIEVLSLYDCIASSRGIITSP